MVDFEITPCVKRVGWSDERIYFDRQDYFKDLLSDIQTAKHSIDLETYIFDFDIMGKRVIAALMDASKRGVQVRVVVDGLGTWFTQDQIRDAFSSSRVQFKIHHPFSFMGFAFTHVNQRLHRKMCLIDHQISYLGSFNITDLPNRDTGVRLFGGPWWSLSRAFDRNWSCESGKGSRTSAAKQVRLNENKKMRRASNLELLRRIRYCDQRIWITNAYFVPPAFVFRALCLAGLRGVDVRLLLPAKPDHIFMKWMAEAFYRTLILSGVRVFQFEGAFLHSKTFLIDDWIVVGSTNLNHRSLVHDLEVDVVLELEASKETLEQQFKKDLEQSRELNLASVRFHFLSRLIQWFFLFFRFYT